MSKNPGGKREIKELSEVPRSSTPEPVPKRPRTSRFTSKLPVQDSHRSDESRARATRGVIASAAGTSEPRGSSMGRPTQTPAVERSSEEETVTESLLPAVEQSWEEGTATVHDDDGQDPRTLDPDGIRGRRLAMDDSERCYGRWSSGEETVTSSMLPVEQPSREVHATDIASGSHSAIGAHPPVDRASTDVLETDDALTEPRRASRTPSEYRASTETDTEVIVWHYRFYCRVSSDTSAS